MADETPPPVGADGRGEWLRPFYELWLARVGIIDPVRAAKALAPAIKLYGAERTLVALREYLDNQYVKVRRLEYFVQDIVRYLPPEGPLVDESGELTDAGRQAYCR